jgi:hypothetical protein
MTTLPDGELEPESSRRPGLELLLLEGRAVLEMAALPVAYPLPRRRSSGASRRGRI